jgi:hypothetical protein
MRPVPAVIFMSRWLQLPLYLGLIVAQGVYVERRRAQRQIVDDADQHLVDPSAENFHQPRSEHDAYDHVASHHSRRVSRLGNRDGGGRPPHHAYASRAFREPTVLHAVGTVKGSIPLKAHD